MTGSGNISRPDFYITLEILAINQHASTTIYYYMLLRNVFKHKSQQKSLFFKILEPFAFAIAQQTFAPFAQEKEKAQTKAISFSQSGICISQKTRFSIWQPKPQPCPQHKSFRRRQLFFYF